MFSFLFFVILFCLNGYPDFPCVFILCLVCPMFLVYLGCPFLITPYKGVIIIRISKKNRQHNGQKKKYKRTNNDLQNIRTPLKPGDELDVVFIQIVYSFVVVFIQIFNRFVVLMLYAYYPRFCCCLNCCCIKIIIWELHILPLFC